MFRKLSELAKCVIYYALAFSLSLGVSVCYPVLGENVVIVTMFTPAAATLIMLLIVTPDGHSRAGWAALGLHRPALKSWIPAIIVPLVVLGCSYGLVWATGYAEFGLSGELADLSVWMLPVMAIVLIGKHLFTGALGEEIGWRGYLLPRLANAIGPRWALPVSGFLHGVWHFPIIFLTPLYHSGADLIFVLPLFLAGATVTGMIVGGLRLSSGSVWPSAIIHSALNVFWALFRMSTLAASPLVAEYLVGESGLLPLTGYVIVVAGAYLLGRPRSRGLSPHWRRMGAAR